VLIRFRVKQHVDFRTELFFNSRFLCDKNTSLGLDTFIFLCFVDRASLYNLVNKTSLEHSLFLVYLSISACFERLWAHHQEKQLCFCDTCYLLFCVDDCLVCRSIRCCTPDSHPHRITSTKFRKNVVVSPDDGSIVARNMQRLINILRINCAPSWFYLRD